MFVLVNYIKSELSNQEIIFTFKNTDLAHWFNLNTLGLFMNPKTSELLSDKTSENFIKLLRKRLYVLFKGKQTLKNLNWINPV